MGSDALYSTPRDRGPLAPGFLRQLGTNAAILFAFLCATGVVAGLVDPLADESAAEAAAGGVAWYGVIWIGPLLVLSFALSLLTRYGLGRLNIRVLACIVSAALPTLFIISGFDDPEFAILLGLVGLAFGLAMRLPSPSVS